MDSPPAHALEIARRWFQDYLTRSHQHIGRSGPVCPFVEPAIKAGTLETRVWPVAPDIDTGGLVEIVHRMTETFDTMAWQGRNRTLHALVVVLPGLADDRLPLLDQAHARMKTELAHRGLMLGQFHAACDERAARNREFMVSRSPVPMLALRHMAFHDVMFLHTDPGWFAAYRARYGARYRTGSVPDPLFAELFAEAQRTWGEEQDKGDQ
ncbi:DUF6875 domain-containing protein [Streptomyces orinoci]|uniref:DUF6875 domain-containing protein n=1 Tax=Streptomyces orinoci TaxID=67339 RepID=A0ABV3K466_STRON|nr:hypothetical protein [Streptomyces orinoci]